MMGQVEISKPLEWQENDQADDLADRFVQASIGERSLVGGLMFQSKQEDQEYAVEREEEGPEGNSDCDQSAGDQDQGKMGHQMQYASPVLSLA